jgi:hypothetical protein
VDEISLVDYPANEEEFLIKKRMEDTMSEMTSNPEIQEPTEVKKAEDTKETQPEPTEEVQKKEKKEETSEVEKALNPVQAMALLKKMFEMMAKAMGYPAPKKAAMEEEEKYPEPKKTQKSILTLTDEGEVVIDPESLQEIAKGRRVFTSNRVTQLVEGLKSIIGLVKEVDGDAYKSLFGELSIAESGIKKDEPKDEAKEEAPKPDTGEIVSKALKDALEPVTKRLDDLEATRGVAKGQGDQKTETVQKSENLWAGVL